RFCSNFVALVKSPAFAAANPMRRMVTRNVFLRPTMSPRRPKKSAPMGRMRKPAPERREARAEGGGLVPFRKEQAAQLNRQRGVDVEIVPSSNAPNEEARTTFFSSAVIADVDRSAPMLSSVRCIVPSICAHSLFWDVKNTV